MSWVITILGIVLLIVAHEFGHFLAAKLVGMRVERFSLFFPPTIAKLKRGETEYGIGLIPAGGYVKITGMTLEESRDLDLRTADRAYCMKPPWRRIVVILAGPGVNLLIAFILFWVVLLSGRLNGAAIIGSLDHGLQTVTLSTRVAAVEKGMPAEGVLRPGDRILTVEGHPATAATIRHAIGTHHCAGQQTQGCATITPVHLTVRRDGRNVAVTVRPRYEAKLKRMLVGFDFTLNPMRFDAMSAATTALDAMGPMMTEALAGIGRALVSSRERGRLRSIVGVTAVTHEAVALGVGRALVTIGYVSLILGVINLLPFLPLDGGHVLWSLAEKARGRRVSATTMWRLSSIGLILLAFLVVNGVGNDISRIVG